MNYANLIQDITENIKTNGSQAITAQVLQDVLVDMVGRLGQSGALFGGVIDTSFVPDLTNDAQVVYIAESPGTYTNFNGLVVGAGEVAFFYFNGNAWAKSSVDVLEVVNNLNSTATDKALSAAMGKQIGDNISQLGQEVEQIEQVSGKIQENFDLKYSANLFDKTSATANRAVRYDTGALAYDTDFYASDYIYIEDGVKQIAVTSGQSYVGVNGIAFYDANKTFISGTTALTVTVPAGAKYVRVSIKATLFDTSMVAYGGEVPETYQPYGVIISAKLKPITLEDTDFSVLQRGKNLLNPEMLIVGKWITRTGNPETVTNNYGYYDYLPIEPSTQYHISNEDGSPLSNRNDCYIAFYEADKTCITSASVSSNTTDVTSPSTAAFIRISLVMALVTNKKPMMELGNERTEYEPYSAPWEVIKEEYLPPIAIQDDSITTAKIKDDSVTLSKLGEGAAQNVEPKNLCNKDAIETGYYFAEYKTVSSTYVITERIKVTPGEKYCISGSAPRFVAFLANEESQASLSYLEYPSGAFTIPSSAHFIVVTFYASAVTDNLQIEEGETPTAYEPYFASYRQIYLRDGQVTKDKLAENVLADAPTFKRFSAKNETLAVDSFLTISNIHITKDFVISARIDGTISSVSVGVAYMSFYGRWVEITPTQLIVKEGSSGTASGTYNHGLTLGEKTTLLIDRDLSSATLTLINDNGELFRQVVTWGVNPGVVFVRNNNSSGTVGAELSFLPKDIAEKIWMFGDSYFSFQDTARWPYYIFQWGYTKPLMDARGGENSGEALNDFLNLVSLGARPTFALWAMGMNDGTDSSSAPSNIWLANTQAFLAKCNEKGITPILCTIPTIPSLDHSQKSAWVRSSGYRYIDMAAAVEEEGTTYWKNWGTASAFLSSDETHPTAYGAKALVSQVMTDFPEIAVL